ncbi:MAG TPA: hypothetical protein VJ719_09060, partial [Chthoniobacterales bacterium]|nr:hypothetical protein [Chthoniobacterales bacterium]
MLRRVVPWSVALALIIGAAHLHAAHLVWSGLIIAQNEENPKPVPSELAPFEQTLKELFGYNEFDIIGQSRKTLSTGQEDWLATSKYFALRVDARGEDDAGYDVNLQLYQDKNLLLETDTKLGQSSPLVIKGPQVGGGQLLLVLLVDDEVKNESAKPRHSHRRASKMTRAWRSLSRFFTGG